MTKIKFSRSTDNYFLDVEHDTLTCWDNSMYPVRQYLTGHKRLHNELWLDLIRRHIEVRHYNNYLVWVESGNGDDWFVEEE